MTIAIGHAMIFNWRRKRAEQRQDLACQRRRLAFERLEERCVPSAKPILSGAASLLLVDQPGNNLLATALSAGNGLGVSPLIVHDGSEPGSACQAKLIQVTDDTSRQDQNVLTTQPLKQSGQNAPLQGGDDVLTNSPELPTSNKGKRFSGSGREANISLVDG